MNLFSMSTFKEIESLWVSNQIETVSLEYKSQITSNEVAKDISSFANSEGGVVIYGIDEENGRAKQSTGIDVSQNSERIQQIISSSTAPEVPITIEVITSKNDSSKEFLIVKIPKSSFFIHQVTTNGKFYVRNNTTTAPQIYNPIEMKENDIALRYESRFRNKLNQKSFVTEKEKSIFSELRWGSGVIFSIIPHVRVPGSINVTKEMFDGLFLKNNIEIYNDLLSTTSIPLTNGRMFDPRLTKKIFVEIDNDHSLWCSRQIGGGFGIDMFEPVFLTGILLHIVNRIWKEHPYYGGMTLRIHVNGTIGVPRDVNGIDLAHGDRSVSDFEIEHELPVGPFDLKVELTKIFERWFEALHLDNPLKFFPKTIPAIEDRLNEADGKC